ncbi:MAG: hypothetical protein IT361_02545 [Gemmatimonadaceae bacterium]|nr:hypothetical protein [Gemmatimonadaceae bacterium]
MPLSIGIEVPQIAVGDAAVILRLIVINESPDTVRFVTQTDNVAFRAFVSDASGRQVWDSQLLQVRTEPANAIAIPGYGRRSFLTPWDFRDNSGARLPAGEYHLSGEVADALAPVSATGQSVSLRLRAVPVRLFLPG